MLVRPRCAQCTNTARWKVRLYLHEQGESKQVEFCGCHVKPFKGDMKFVVRGDYRMVGKTYWGPGDVSITPLPWDQIPRNEYDVLDLRVGLQGKDWDVTLWSKNALDEKYNDEFSYPFVWKAQPEKWGIQYTKDF